MKNPRQEVFLFCILKNENSRSLSFTKGLAQNQIEIDQNYKTGFPPEFIFSILSIRIIPVQTGIQKFNYFLNYTILVSFISI